MSRCEASSDSASKQVYNFDMSLPFEKISKTNLKYLNVNRQQNKIFAQCNQCEFVISCANITFIWHDAKLILIYN